MHRLFVYLNFPFHYDFFFPIMQPWCSMLVSHLFFILYECFMFSEAVVQTFPLALQRPENRGFHKTYSHHNSCCRFISRWCNERHFCFFPWYVCLDVGRGYHSVQGAGWTVRKWDLWLRVTQQETGKAW